MILTEKRKTPDAVAAASEAAEALSENQTTPKPKTSKTDDITELTEIQGRRILPLLEKGLENAKTTAELKTLLQCPERTIRELVEQERRQGALILANPNPPGGYYCPADGSKGITEMKKSYHTARAKALGYLIAAAPIYYRLKELGALSERDPAQISIDDLEEKADA